MRCRCSMLFRLGWAAYSPFFIAGMQSQATVVRETVGDAAAKINACVNKLATLEVTSIDRSRAITRTHTHTPTHTAIDQAPIIGFAPLSVLLVLHCTARTLTAG